MVQYNGYKKGYKEANNDMDVSGGSNACDMASWILMNNDVSDRVLNNSVSDRVIIVQDILRRIFEQFQGFGKYYPKPWLYGTSCWYTSILWLL